MTAMIASPLFEAMAFTRPALALPTNRDRRKHQAQHATAEADRLWTPFTDFVISLINVAVIAGGLRFERTPSSTPQIDSEPSGEVPRPPVTTPPVAALTAAFKGMADAWRAAGWLPPEPPRGWRGWWARVCRWFAAWRQHDVARARLLMVREWCYTIALMAGCGTFLYICWALVDWIPA